MPTPAPIVRVPEPRRIAVFGGLYSNYLALEVAIADARRRGSEALYCLGDLGAFGPYPDRVFPLLHEHKVEVIQGNYDHSIGNELADCQCGYTDPRDNLFAQISYNYTLANTAPENRRWLKSLPGQARIQLGRYAMVLCHGSPRRTNEFLWESTTSSAFLEHLLHASSADVILATHTGIKWHRRLADDRHFVNVGVLGRPENDGRTEVWYTLIEARPEFYVEFVPVAYDSARLAHEMRQQGLPEEFVETVLTGWWTTCLEVLPAKERGRGRW